MRVVVALGGNALLHRGDRPDSAIQQERTAAAVSALVPLIDAHEVIVTHGNGPQVGVLAIESAMDRSLQRPYPLDTLGAETQGLIGYWLVQELRNHLPGRAVAAVVTQTVVDPGDAAFATPTKFVGPTYAAAEAEALARQRGWRVVADGDGWRRVVPSPAPLRIVEADVVRLLVDAGVVVVCAGGGGVPVVETADGRLHGVEAVIDKDLTAALLAEELRADALIVLTDVAGVFRDYGTDEAALIREIDIERLRALAFPAGSMGPKVEAVCRFVERTGGFAAIGALTEARAVVAGERGTLVRPPRG